MASSLIDRLGLLLLVISLCCVPAVIQGAGNESDHASTEEGSHDEPLPVVSVAELRFDEIQVIMIVVGFIMAAVLAKIMWHSHILEKIASSFPESCMLIVLGVFTGGIIVSSFRLSILNQLKAGEMPEVRSGPCQTLKSSPISFSSHLFFQFLLPPIVLESGYFLNKGLFFKNLFSIVAFAFIGTLFNALAVGACVYGVGLTGVLKAEWVPAAALLFGVITSAVDPVAVLAVFEQIHVGPILHILVFGESLLNDAVTVVLFNLLSVFADKQALGAPITGTDVGLGIAQFLVVISASILIGIIVGVLAAAITRFSEPVHIMEPVIVWAMGYLAYMLADGFALSGIISLIVCAMVMRHYMEPNLSHKSAATIKYSLKAVSSVSESVIFLFLGISLYETRSIDIVLIIVCILFCLVFRPISVVVLSLLLNLVRRKKIGWKEQLIMSYSGLRGAVAFSLALLRFTNLAEEGGSEPSPNECLLREQQVLAILALTIFTVFIQGTTIKPLVRLTHVRLASTRKETLNESVHAAAIDHITAGVEEITGQIGLNTIKDKILEFDAKYIRPLLERYPNSVDHHIMNTFTRLQYRDTHKVVKGNYVFELEQKPEDGVIRLEAAEPKEEEPVQLVRPGRQLSIDVSECDFEVPALEEIMSYSFAHPHADHMKNALSVYDREHACDHRFEPVQHHRTKVQRRLRKRYSKRTGSKSPTSPGSLLRVFRPSSRGELPIVAEEPDYPTTPSPVNPTESSYPAPFSPPHEMQVTVEMSDRPLLASSTSTHPQSQETEV